MAVINPKIILDRGILKIPQDTDSDKILQPNGIDLYVKEIFELYNGTPIILGDNIPTRHAHSKKKESCVSSEGQAYYCLEAGRQYKIETGYELCLPENMVAYIFTRSSLNRNGILVGSGLWDSGYHGPVGTTIYTFNELQLVPPCRIAQIVFLEAESSSLYKGNYNDATLKSALTNIINDHVIHS